ncbi:MAG: polysaccharide deacetylase family protein [Cytophagaceae bacterium]|nr:polysaccharide deacetylase family protein [Cytophagaceae bacterium]
MRSLSLVFFSLLAISSFAQNTNDSVYIAPYRNNALGAYTLIHDDFGAAYARGIEQYADTMAYKRGIPFSFAVITGECDETDWQNANQLIKHGHQILNHSMSHKCGQPQGWCSFGNWDEKDFPVEIDNSTKFIEDHTHHHPAFFVFPFDLFTDTMISYLQAKNYAGARSGAQNQMNADIEDAFRLNFNVYHPVQSFAVLNGFAEQAMINKSWAIRVIHGVNDDSWGKIPLKEYEDHLNYLKRKSDSNLLWIANLSDLVLYNFLRDNYKVESVKDKFGRVSEIKFQTIRNVKINGEYYSRLISTSKSKTLTIVLNDPKRKIRKVSQQDKRIPFKLSQGKLLIEADPSAGPVTISY